MWELDHKERSKQSILKEIIPDYSLEELMLKLKLQYFGHLMQSVDSLKNTLTMGKIEVRRRGHQRMRWLDSTAIQWTWVSATLGDSEKQGGLASWSPWECRVWHDWVTELQHWYVSKNTEGNFGQLNSCLIVKDNCVYPFSCSILIL